MVKKSDIQYKSRYTMVNNSIITLSFGAQSAVSSPIYHSIEISLQPHCSAQTVLNVYNISCYSGPSIVIMCYSVCLPEGRGVLHRPSLVATQKQSQRPENTQMTSKIQGKVPLAVKLVSRGRMAERGVGREKRCSEKGRGGGRKREKK